MRSRAERKKNRKRCEKKVLNGQKRCEIANFEEFPIENLCNPYTLRTLIFTRHLFSRLHIFAAYIFASEALGINFRYVSIFAWWLFSLFSPENPLEVIFAPVYMLIQI